MEGEANKTVNIHSCQLYCLWSGLHQKLWPTEQYYFGAVFLCGPNLLLRCIYNFCKRVFACISFLLTEMIQCILANSFFAGISSVSIKRVLPVLLSFLKGKTIQSLHQRIPNICIQFKPEDRINFGIIWMFKNKVQLGN